MPTLRVGGTQNQLSMLKLERDIEHCQLSLDIAICITEVSLEAIGSFLIDR